MYRGMNNIQEAEVVVILFYKPTQKIIRFPVVMFPAGESSGIPSFRAERSGVAK